MEGEPYGALDEAMLRPPRILGCERVPFLTVIGAATFATVTGFGLTLPGIMGGVLLAAAGVTVLRGVAASDPFWFAVLFEAARYPRRMPDVLPDRSIPRDLAFVGYDDPPSTGVTLLVRTLAVTGAALPAGAAWALLGPVPALCVAGALAAVLGAAIVRHMPGSGGSGDA